jgi:hypothetical protein
MLSPIQAVLASGTSAKAKAEALTTAHAGTLKLISLVCPPDVQDERLKVVLTEVVDRELALALGSLVEHFPQLHHSVYQRMSFTTCTRSVPLFFLNFRITTLARADSPMLTSTVT